MTGKELASPVLQLALYHPENETCAGDHRIGLPGSGAWYLEGYAFHPVAELVHDS